MTLNCIKCGVTAENVRIAVDVDTGEIHCDACDCDYTAADVRAVLAAWGPVLDWVGQRPARKPAAPNGGD